MAKPDIVFAVLDRGSRERFQSLRRQLVVRSFGMNLIVLQPWTSWKDDGPGLPPQEIPLPDDLPTA